LPDGPTVGEQDQPNCPKAKWCMLLNTTFPITPPPAPPLSAAPCIRFGHTVQLYAFHPSIRAAFAVTFY